MSLEVIHVTRHGFRTNWSLNSATGVYSTGIPTPTGIPNDPPLTSYGVDQARQLADYLAAADPPIERFYSSPFYRCIQTIDPTLKRIKELQPSATEHKIYLENGVGEWFGSAAFSHPSPATSEVLKRLFPRVDDTYEPKIVPNVQGESIAQLHDRTAYALQRMIEDCDKAGVKSIVVCSHAATIFAIGRALTGHMPEAIDEQDFNPFTCSVSMFSRRRSRRVDTTHYSVDQKESQSPNPKNTPRIEWRNGVGVGGGWDCVLNSDCSFLSGGAERGWHFTGDESFISFPEQEKAVDNTHATSITEGINSKIKPSKPGSGSRL